jgi:ABC-2 type transport system permease protein
MGVFFIFFVLSGVHFQASALLLIVYLAELYILVVGLAFLLCSLYPKFRDIHHIWEVFVQLGFWATPIIYPITIVPVKFHKLIFLNPVARIIQGCREAVIGGSSQFSSFTNHAIIIFVVVCLFVVGLGMFNKLSRSFAEDL